MSTASKFSNESVVKLLRDVAAAYEIKGNEPFRIRAYINAADAIEHASSEVKDLWDDDNLQEIPGIGKGIAAYLDEYFRTGKVAHFEELKEKYPLGMFNLLGVPSVGPKRAYRLAKELKLDSVEELRKACEAHQVANLDGFGELSEQEILKGILELESRSERILLPIAFSIAQRYLNYLQKCPEVVRADPLGSLRRRVATVGDLDIAVATKDPPAVTKYFTKYSEISRILSCGDNKASVVLKTGQQVDLMTQKPEAYGALLQHFTGSKNHNIHLRAYAQEHGLSLSEYGIKKGEKLREYATEEDFYQALGMDWIPPELREDTGEIEAALAKKLPQLVEAKDILGDLHSHTVYSDGQNRPEKMLEVAKSLGWKYLAMTDHCPSLKTRSKKEIEAWISQRDAEIKTAAKKVGIEAFSGVEVNIDAEGQLAFPDVYLSHYDLVIASIHTSFNQSKDRLTKRLLVAANNPHVDIIAHPTGRLLNTREGYDVDWPEVFKACARTQTALEINCQFDRLDLPDTLVREGLKYGVIFAIGSDSHTFETLDSLEYGVSVARRGWCSKRSVVNCWSLKELNFWLKRS